MSRIGRLPVTVQTVSSDADGQLVTVLGPRLTRASCR
jgi:hypothetical protein